MSRSLIFARFGSLAFGLALALSPALGCDGQVVAGDDAGPGVTEDGGEAGQDSGTPAPDAEPSVEPGAEPGSEPGSEPGAEPDGGPIANADAGPAPVDDGGSTTDAGGSTGDDGGPAADSGTPVDGGGAPNADGGSAANDAGAPSDAGPTDAGAPDGGAPDSGAPNVDAGPPTYAGCIADISLSEAANPDYDQFSPTVAADCSGTRHQDIEQVDRVVFLGDSITVGTPPTQSAQFYRSRMAAALANRFNIEAPSNTWRAANAFTGQGAVRESGAFAVCAEWGARNDDLLQDGTQIEDCIPQDVRNQTTLVVMTSGGNDVANLVRRGTDPNVSEEDLWLQVDGFVQLLDETLAWLYTPGRFPNGVYVVFANLYEYTDATGDVLSCPAAGTAGFDENWEDQELLTEMIVYANEEYARLATEYQADMIFMLERFCGHGFYFDDETGGCYRGPDAERWFDFTCIHPTPRGHAEIADLFLSVID